MLFPADGLATHHASARFLTLDVALGATAQPATRRQLLRIKYGAITRRHGR